MRLLCYAKETDDVVAKLLGTVLSQVSVQNLELYQSLAGLKQRLLDPNFEMGFTVLVATTRKELDRFLAIRDMLSDFRIILVLPDHENDTLSKGHRLSPHFISYIDGDFSDLVTVLSLLTTGKFEKIKI